MTGDERAVSELIGFVLVFALVVTTVVIVTIAGVTELENQRHAERLQNAERAFDVLANNVGDVGHGAPNRGTEIKLSGNEIQYGEPVQFNVSVNRTIPGRTNFSRTETTPIVYRSGDTALSYASGAVFRDETAGAVMVRSPATVLSRPTTVLELVRTTPVRGSSRSVGGDTTMLVRTTKTSQMTTLYRRGGRSEVTVNVTGDHAASWADHYETQITDAGIGARADPCQSVDGDTISCQFVTEQLYVVETRVAVSFV